MNLDTISHRAANLRCVLMVLAAMLSPLGAAFSRSDANWPAVTIECISAGIIAWRCFLDQSMARRDNTPDADSSDAEPPSATGAGAAIS